MHPSPRPYIPPASCPVHSLAAQSATPRRTSATSPLTRALSPPALLLPPSLPLPRPTSCPQPTPCLPPDRQENLLYMRRNRCRQLLRRRVTIPAIRLTSPKLRPKLLRTPAVHCYQVRQTLLKTLCRPQHPPPPNPNPYPGLPTSRKPELSTFFLSRTGPIPLIALRHHRPVDGSALLLHDRGRVTVPPARTNNLSRNLREIPPVLLPTTLLPPRRIPRAGQAVHPEDHI